MAEGVDRVFQLALNEVVVSADPPSKFYGVEDAEGALLLPTYLRQVITSNSRWLSFTDPIDRSACSIRFERNLRSLVEATIECVQALVPIQHRSEFSSQLVEALTLELALASQLIAICGSTERSDDNLSAMSDLVTTIANALMRVLLRRGFGQLREMCKDNRRHAKREAGITDQSTDIQAVVVLRHSLARMDDPALSMWQFFNRAIEHRLKDCSDVYTMEELWLDIFTLLPFYELDSTGVLKLGYRFQAPFDNWTVVDTMLSRVFELYQDTALQGGNNINSYIRTLLSRCNHLINAWGWKHCESAIVLIFDFFAKNKLAPLRNEKARGSPRFLEQLNVGGSLSILPEDNAFHVFLKVLASGLSCMTAIYPEKKIRSLVWRCIPNHGRTYEKKIQC